MMIMDVALGVSTGQVSKAEVSTSVTVVPSLPNVLALTRQEIECLRWCKEGKTNWEIGGISGDFREDRRISLRKCDEKTRCREQDNGGGSRTKTRFNRAVAGGKCEPEP